MTAHLCRCQSTTCPITPLAQKLRITYESATQITFIGAIIDQEDKFFELLGLGVPLSLGATTYGVFAWLDSNASDEATKVISSWLHGRSHNKPDLGNLIINAFDRIYTSPLLTFRAFRRSATISMLMWLLGYFIPFCIGFLFFPEHNEFHRIMEGLSLIDLFVGLILTLPFIILSDYISLFFVRTFLSLARVHPVIASIGAFIIGVGIILAIFGLLGTALAPLWIVDSDKEILDVAPDFVINLRIDYILLGGLGSPLGILSPALIIHLWLPLFALSSLAARLVFPMFRAAEKAQWFLKQGDTHPLKAIGVVATIIVFGSAMLVKEAWTVL
jgi:hypothetical protein